MNKLLIISALIILTSCSQQTKPDKKQTTNLTKSTTEIQTSKTNRETEIENVSYTDINFNSAKQQADSILAFMKKAKNSSSTNRIKWEQKFFCAFPNSFKGMKIIFGYDNENGAAPLYDYPKGANIIQYFSQMESIPDSIYYNKYVKINIDGIWESDNITEAFNFANRLTKNTQSACKVLSTFSDREIKSVFRFVFDGPHPKNKYNKKLYKNLKPKIENHNKRLSRLLTESYEKIMNEGDGH